MFSGEALDIKFLDHLSDKDKTVLNYYGPTETGEVTLHKFNLQSLKEGQTSARSVIGKHFDYTTTYVLDNNLSPLPRGAIGELYIGGIGLARGYLNSPESTAQKFIVNPFQTEKERASNKNSRLYKTGDLGRYLSDGNIES